jgi:hypothetical protein
MASSLQEQRTANAWGPEEIAAWRKRHPVVRSYQKDVVARLKKLSTKKLNVQQYGALSHDPERYPLYRVLSKNWNNNNPTILITGGVHGYEDSGITGALRFLEEVAPKYAGKVNFVVYPCVSPFAYEINHRWNWNAQDPNRHFRNDLPTLEAAEESALLMRSLTAAKQELLGTKPFDFAIDLHETNYRDIELGKERHARDGSIPPSEPEVIPNGFYLCVTGQEHVATGQQFVEAARKETPICTDEQIIGYANQKGVIVVDDVTGVCQGFTATLSRMSMTTEIYPDKSPVREAQNAQLAVLKKAIALVLR